MNDDNFWKKQVAKFINVGLKGIKSERLHAVCSPSLLYGSLKHEFTSQRFISEIQKE